MSVKNIKECDIAYLRIVQAHRGALLPRERAAG